MNKCWGWFLVFLCPGAVFAQLPGNGYFVSFPKTAAEAKAQCQHQLAKAKQAVDQIAARPREQNTFANTLWALDDIFNELDETTVPIQLTKRLGAPDDLVDAAIQCDSDIKTLMTQQYQRSDLYRAVEPFLSSAAPGVPQDSVATHFQEVEGRTFRVNGAFLPLHKQKEFLGAQEQVNLLAGMFRKQTQAVKYLEIPRPWLSELPPALQERIEKDALAYRKEIHAAAEEKPYAINLVSDLAVQFLTYSPNPEARKAMLFAINTRAGWDNVRYLETVLQLRRQMAKLIGYKNYAQMVIEDKMARTPERVAQFLAKFESAIAGKRDQEKEALRRLKCGAQPATACDLESFDYFYYADQYKKQHLNVDEQALRQALPVDRVVQSAFALAQEWMGLAFAEKALPQGLAPASADPKRLSFYEVKSADSQNLVGYLLADLYYRPGKSRGVFEWAMRLPRTRPSGETQLPLIFISTAFDPPLAEGRPATIYHASMISFYHEFGHALHAMLGRAPYGAISSNNVKRDFMEVPSQVFEQWAWEPAVLAGIGVPEPLIKAKIKNRYFDAGSYHAGQLMRAESDLLFYLARRPDTTKIFSETAQRVRGYAQLPKTFPQANWTHPVEEYGAGYYEYSWSLAVAYDLYEKLAQANADAAAKRVTGQAYVSEILAPGGGRAPEMSIQRFLGRNWNTEAFFKIFATSR